IGADGAMALRFEVAERGGDQVVTAQKVTVKIEDRVLVDKFSGIVQRGDVLGFLGPNGSGKSTLLKALFGDFPLSGGELKTGSSITAGYYRQDLSQVPLDKTLYDCINDLRPLWERRLVQGHLGRFGFSGDEVQRKCGTLSGGERARVALAMLMLSRANLIVLDEPTNHLDVESIEALEDAIESYDGTVILVSHDRGLLRALTSKVWVLHDRHITEFPEGFAEWEEVSAERAHAAKVRASEDQALLKVHERQKVAQAKRAPEPSKPKDGAKALRQAQRALETAEVKVATMEEKVAALTAALEDPALYTKPNGVGEAKRLGTELETLKKKLDSALAEWSGASEAVETQAGKKG
ncbi:MAG TPA: ATP-binding cassette domain-containing protein, partial [Gemmatimonadales bacterium]